MAKNRKGRGGSSQGTPRSAANKSKPSPQNKPKGHSRARNNNWRDEDSTHETATFTLRDAARSSGFRASGGSLRFKSIGFVKSTDPHAFQPEDVLKPKEEPHEQEFTEVRPNEPIIPPPSTKPPSDAHTMPVIIPKAGSYEEDEEKPSFQVSPSPTPSSSSEEVVVFKGRNPDKASTVSSVSGVQKDSGNERPGKSTKEISQAAAIEIQRTEDITAIQDANGNRLIKSTEQLTISPTQRKERRGGNDVRSTRKRMMGRETTDSDEVSDGAVDDYLANLRENGEVGNDSEENFGFGTVPNGNDWHTSDLEDLGDLSTSEEVLGSVKAILSKRKRRNGVQYLVVWHGLSADEARWVPQSSLTSVDGAMELIETFEAEEKLVPQYDGVDESSEDDDDEDDDDEAFEDERDLYERRMARMTDEKIARMLAKQEEMGIKSDEVLLWDGDEEDDIEEALARSSHKNGSRKKRSGQRGLMTNDYDMGGDDYGDFDVMDHERPSLLRTPKRNGNLTAELLLSDSDLEANLRAQWTSDRKKKRQQKIEREELRAQGLLGRRQSDKGMPNLQEKYSDGITMDQLRDSLKDFLLGTDDNLALPPMEKRERKIMHEVATQFGMKSGSRGKGRARFTVLSKTKKLRDFDDDTFDQLARQLVRRAGNTFNGKSVSSRSKNAAARAAGRASAGYRDGEIVGAGAAEIGTSNRGRVLLEKMGWSTGTALGAGDNKGILKPIEHVVKNTTAGLGL